MGSTERPPDTFETIAAVAVGDAVRSEITHTVFGLARPTE